MTTPHPELDTLAELADTVDAGAAAQATDPAGNEQLAHVRACPQCQADLTALRGVRDMLRSLPPIPMPDDVASRLDAALREAAGATGFSGAARPVAASAPGTDAGTTSAALGAGGAAAGVATPLTKAAADATTGGRPRRWAFPLSAAASVAVLAALALGGAIVMATLHSGNPTKKSASTAASASSALVITTSGHDYSPADLQAQVASLVLQRVPAAAQQYKGLAHGPDELNDAHGAAVTSPSAPASAAGPAASAAPTAAASSAAGSAFATAPSPASSSGSYLTSASVVPLAAAPTVPTGPLADHAQLLACAHTLATPGQSDQPVLVDYALYKGQPATIIVMPLSSSKLAAYVELNTANCLKGDVTFVGFLPGSS